MRILHAESSRNWGGRELRALEQVRWLNDHGHESWVAGRANSKILEKAEIWGLPYFVVPFRGVIRPSAIVELYSLVRKHRFDIIDCHGDHDALHCAFMRMTGTKVVRSLHSEKINTRVSKKLLWKYGNDRIIAVADVSKSNLIAAGLPSDKIDVINEGIDLSEFDFRLTGQNIRQEFNIPNHCKVVTNIGMIRPNKGQQYFIKAADAILSAIPETRFLIVGEATKPEFDTELRAHLEASPHRDKFILTGYRKDVADFIAASDCVVISSLAEACPRVVPQSFAMKRPVVATNVGGTAEMVKSGKTGMLVPPADSPALAASVIKVLQTDMNSILENAYKMAQERLEINIMMKHTLETYEHTLAML